MKYCLVLLYCCASLSAFSIRKTELKAGDLIFQDLDCGGMCDAIEAVTEGYHNRDFSHMGMVSVMPNGTYYVLESIGKGVQETELDEFLKRSTHAHLVARVKKSYRSLIPAAVAFCQSKVGGAYDEEFLYNNGKYYCSELIYDAFKSANEGQPFFQLYPMTYKDPSTGSFYPVWESYFRNLKVSIPEGLPGCNPGGMSTSDKIKVLGDLEG